MAPTYAGRGICADMTMGSRVLCNEPLLWRTGGLMVSESYRVSPDYTLQAAVGAEDPRLQRDSELFRRYRYHSLRGFTGELRGKARASTSTMVNSAKLD